MLVSAPSTSKSQWFDFLINHSIKVLILIFALGSLIIFLYLSKVSNEQIKINALKSAALYTETLTLFRTLYTSEVVNKLTKNGIEISHDYASKKNAIPLPATLSMVLGNQLGGDTNSVSSKLYSPYPFPWREATGGLTDDFSRAAWQALIKDPSQAYYQFEMSDGLNSLRYASADLMRPSCINCHNTHPDTPKKGWMAGDLRGILEINIPIDQHISQANQMVRKTLYLLVTILICTLAGVGLVIKQLKLRTDQAQQAQQQLLTISLTDSLTGIANRRHFDQDFDLEWRRAMRTQTSIAVALFDVDDFKSYNDNYGHQDGDIALQKIAQIMAMSVQRASDLLARYGGEEFILLLPNTDIAGATNFCDKIRQKISESQIEHQHSRTAQVITISVGVAAVVPSEELNPLSLIKAADAALYQAKSQGRNCVCQSGCT